jgi:hypothetical protein
MLFGIGGASYTTVEEFPEMDEDGEWDTERKLLESDVFWVFEPGLTLEIYLTRFMKMSAGVNYRLVSPLDMTDTPTNAFNGYSGTVSLKFGRF